MLRPLGLRLTLTCPSRYQAVRPSHPPPSPRSACAIRPQANTRHVHRGRTRLLPHLPLPNLCRKNQGPRLFGRPASSRRAVSPLDCIPSHSKVHDHGSPASFPQFHSVPQHPSSCTPPSSTTPATCHCPLSSGTSSTGRIQRVCSPPDVSSSHHHWMSRPLTRRSPIYTLPETPRLCTGGWTMTAGGRSR